MTVESELVRCFPHFLQHLYCRASGHVDRFLDYMVKDVKTGDCFRVDHLIKSHLEEVNKDKRSSEDDKKRATGILTQVRKALNLAH